jgi:hypothetical protein
MAGRALLSVGRAPFRAPRLLLTSREAAARRAPSPMSFVVSEETGFPRDEAGQRYVPQNLQALPSSLLCVGVCVATQWHFE